MHSIRVKLLLCFFASTFVVWALLSYWAFFTTRSVVERQTLSVLQSAIETEVLSTNNNFMKVEMVASLIGNLQELEQYLSSSFATPHDEYRIAQNMFAQLENLLRGMGISTALTIVSHNSDIKEIIPADVENLIHTGVSRRSVLDTQGQVSIALYKAKRFQVSDPVAGRTNWYLQAANNEYGWMQTPLDEQQGSISLIHPLPASPFSSSRGIIKISVRLEDMITGLPAQNCIILIDKNGSPILTQPDSEGLPDGVGEEKEAYTAIIKGGNAVLSGKLNNGWRLYHIFPYDGAEAFADIQYQFIALLIVSLVLSLGFAVFFSNWFTQRIRVVRDSLHRFETGHYDHRIAATGSDEIGMLAVGYNNMAEHINRLIRDVYQTEIRSQREHLTMLQSQIRPHFLYNSLSAIVRLCDRGDVSLIKDMVQALVQFYRISLAKGHEMITLQEEIHHIDAYTRVCSIRYREKFIVEFDLDEAAKQCYVPKIILQPFVENALEHGMDPILGVLHIRIGARVDRGTLTVEISDDGIGIESSRLEHMQNEEITASSGYGISNVRERIRITYGEPWGVYLAHNEPHGLTARLLMEARYQPSSSEAP